MELNLTVKPMQESKKNNFQKLFFTCTLLNLVFFCNFHEFPVNFTKCKRLCTYKSFLFLLSLCLQSLSFFFSEGLTLFSVFSFSLHLLEKGYHQYEFQKRRVDFLHSTGMIQIRITDLRLLGSKHIKRSVK